MAQLFSLSPEQREAKLSVERLNQELKQGTHDVQMSILEITNLKQRVEDCISKQCAEVQKQLAKEVEEQEAQEKKSSQLIEKGGYIKTPSEFLASRFFGLHRALVVNDANSCMEEC